MSERYLAHVIDGVVVGVSVISDETPEEFYAAIAPEFDALAEVTGLTPRPDIGWSYDGTTFTPPPSPDPDPAP